MRYYKRSYQSIILLIIGAILISCSTIDSGWKGSSTIQLTDIERALVLATAKRQIGTPYRLGGNSPQQGLDCSGLIYHAYGSIGVKIPRTTAEQARWFRGEKYPQVGDIIFFKVNKRTVSHAGIYLGNQQMLHAPGRGRRVEVTQIDLPYWQKRFYKYGRI